MVRLSSGGSLAAVGALAVGAMGITGFGIAVAAGHPVGHARNAGAGSKPKPPATFQMYANVDAEGEGSNYDAVSASILPGSIQYIVKFAKPIGHCAAVAQVGRAGGPDEPTVATPIVTNEGKRSFNITFETNDAGGTGLHHEPFMVTVTCLS